jgi:hypothetical protein
MKVVRGSKILSPLTKFSLPTTKLKRSDFTTNLQLKSCVPVRECNSCTLCTKFKKGLLVILGLKYKQTEKN